MVFDAICLLLLGLASVLAGQLAFKVLFRSRETEPFDITEKGIVGLSTLIVLSAWMAWVEVPLSAQKTTLFSFFVFPFFLIAIKKLVQKMLKISPNGNGRISFQWVITIFLFLYVELIHNGALLTSRISMRNGPDIVGWTNSTIFFAKGGRISELENRVLKIFDSESIKELIKVPTNALSEHLYRIPSFTDQINTEFILVSKRFSLQYFLGIPTSVLPDERATSVIVGFIVLNMILQFSIMVKILRMFAISGKATILTASVLVIGINNVEIVLQGGLGQYFSLTYFLYFIYLSLDSSSKELKRATLLKLMITISALSCSYFDGVIFLAAMSSIFFLLAEMYCLIGKKRFLRIKYRKLKHIVFVGLTSFLLALPVTINVIDLIAQRVSGHRGGWYQGRFAGPADLSGMYNWFPKDSVGITSFNSIALSLNLFWFFIILFIWKSKKLDWKLKIIFATFLFMYLYFCFDVYVLNSDLINNYNLIKFGLYLTVSNLLIVVCMAQWIRPMSNIHKYSNSSWLKARAGRIVWVALLLSLGISNVSYTANWLGNRQFTVTGEDYRALKSLYTRNNIVLAGFSGAGFAKMTLIGNLNYGVVSRGFGVSSLTQFPDDQTKVVAPKGYCIAGTKCFANFEGQQRLLRLNSSLKDFEIYDLQALR
jgi:hypothetical protein